MRHERTLVNILTCLRSQTHFPGCKRANKAKPRLQNNNANCNQVHAAETHLSYPLPLQKKARINQYQPENNKSHKRYVRDQYRISGKRVQRTDVDKAS